MENKKNNRKRKKWLLLLLILVVIIALLKILFYEDLNQPDSGSQSSSSLEYSSAPVKSLDENGDAIDGAAKSKSEDIKNELKKKQVNVTDKLSSGIQFSCGKKGSSGSWTVENTDTNTVIMQAEVYLGDKLIIRTVPI